MFLGVDSQRVKPGHVPWDSRENPISLGTFAYGTMGVSENGGSSSHHGFQYSNGLMTG